jgi:hypothetical protein
MPSVVGLFLVYRLIPFAEVYVFSKTLPMYPFPILFSFSKSFSYGINYESRGFTSFSELLKVTFLRTESMKRSGCPLKEATPLRL